MIREIQINKNAEYCKVCAMDRNANECKCSIWDKDKENPIQTIEEVGELLTEYFNKTKGGK